VFSSAASTAGKQPAIASSKEIDISSDWKVTFRGLNITVEYPRLHSWTEDERTRFYSGEAEYQKVVDVPASGAKRIVLAFGPGTPIEPGAGTSPGMHTLLEGPAHESAVVFVNGTRAGSIWHPPYSLDLSRYIKLGRNELKLVVGNTAMNELAGHALPDFRLLNLRYGERFTPQDVKDIRPLPSGITGPVKLMISETPSGALR
jgi:hypothetical protein